MKKYFLLAFTLFSLGKLFPQTNFDICQDLINKTVIKIDSLINEKEINLVIISPLKLEQIKPIIKNSFAKNGYKFINDNTNVVVYFVSDFIVNYKNVFSRGFFGNNKIERKIFLRGSVLIPAVFNISKPYDFSFEYTDTLKHEDIVNVEDTSKDFVHGEIPEPPLLKNLFEPILIVGTLITTVILFFTVRSK